MKLALERERLTEMLRGGGEWSGSRFTVLVELLVMGVVQLTGEPPMK